MTQPSQRALNFAADRIEAWMADYPSDASHELAAKVRAGECNEHPWVEAFARFEAETIEWAAKVAEAHSGMQCGPYTREVTSTVAAAIRARHQQGGSE